MTGTLPGIEIDLGSSVPPYEQIRLQVLAHVSAGHLRAGDRLPTIRALATDLGVAAGTVARAFRELEQAGVVTTRRRTGTVVADSTPAPDTAVQDAAAQFVTVARSAGLDDDEALAAVRGALLRPGPRPGPSGAGRAAAPA